MIGVVRPKRYFVPTSDSLFGQSKKRKTLAGPEPVTSSVQLSANDLLGSWECQRQALINQATYPCSQSAALLTNSQLSTEDRQWLEIRKRPKFKARPLPASLNKPTVIRPMQDKTTVPQEFNLSTPKKTSATRKLPLNSPLQRENQEFQKQFQDLTLAAPNFVRSRFQEKLKATRQAKAERRAAAAAAAAQKEAEEVARLRKQRHFKARPMPVYSHFAVTRSNANLTVPRGPSQS